MAEARRWRHSRPCSPRRIAGLLFALLLLLFMHGHAMGEPETGEPRIGLGSPEGILRRERGADELPLRGTGGDSASEVSGSSSRLSATPDARSLPGVLLPADERA